MPGINKRPAFKPKEAPTPETSMRLGPIGLNTDAMVITVPPARYAGQISRSISARATPPRSSTSRMELAVQRNRQVIQSRARQSKNAAPQPWRSESSNYVCPIAAVQCSRSGEIAGVQQVVSAEKPKKAGPCSEAAQVLQRQQRAGAHDAIRRSAGGGNPAAVGYVLNRNRGGRQHPVAGSQEAVPWPSASCTMSAATHAMAPIAATVSKIGRKRFAGSMTMSTLARTMPPRAANAFVPFSFTAAPHECVRGHVVCVFPQFRFLRRSFTLLV